MTVLILQRFRPEPPVLLRRFGPDQRLAAQAESGALPPGVAVVGAPGTNAALYEAVAAVAVAAGQPVRPNAQGKLALAQADSLANARQVALATEAIAAEFAGQISRDFVTLADWTAATGAAELVPQTDYFLSAATAGRLTTVPPGTGVVLAIGVALNPTTLAVNIGPPILL